MIETSEQQDPIFVALASVYYPMVIALARADMGDNIPALSDEDVKAIEVYRKKRASYLNWERVEKAHRAAPARAQEKLSDPPENPSCPPKIQAAIDVITAYGKGLSFYEGQITEIVRNQKMPVFYKYDGGPAEKLPSNWKSFLGGVSMVAVPLRKGRLTTTLLRRDDVDFILANGCAPIDAPVEPLEPLAPQPKFVSLASAKTACAKWLKEISAPPNTKEKSKAEYFAEAKKKFNGLSDRGFKIAWDGAVPEIWSQPGRRGS